jgi:hypothetical protein
MTVNISGEEGAHGSHDKRRRLAATALLFAGVYAWYWWSRRKKIIVSVTSDGLTVKYAAGRGVFVQRRETGHMGVTGGATMGTALHLHCRQHRFILGGRDRRVASGARLDAPDAGYGQSVDVDAWLSAAEFEEILTLVGRRSGLDVRPPAPGQPTRCLLFPNSLLVQEMGSFAPTPLRPYVQELGSEPRTCHQRCSDQPLVHGGRHARVHSWDAATDHWLPRHRLGFGPAILVARQRTYRTCAS